jgi:hypothetical protein
MQTGSSENNENVVHTVIEVAVTKMPVKDLASRDRKMLVNQERLKEYHRIRENFQKIFVCPVLVGADDEFFS